MLHWPEYLLQILSPIGDHSLLPGDDQVLAEDIEAELTEELEQFRAVTCLTFNLMLFHMKEITNVHLFKPLMFPSSSGNSAEVGRCSFKHFEVIT